MQFYRNKISRVINVRCQLIYDERHSLLFMTVLIAKNISVFLLVCIIFIKLFCSRNSRKIRAVPPQINITVV